MIKIERLNKSFGEKQILENFHYTILDQSMIAIVGPSGCGKSTLLNMIGLLDLEYEGTISYDGELISQKKEKQRIRYIRDNINYLFQNYALIDSETVEYNLLLALTYEKLDKKEKRNKVNEVLKKVGLEDYNTKKIYTLSGGEQQRIALARVMLKKGNIVLADEPTGNLDKENSQQVIHILRELQKLGKTIIVVTHSMEVAQECDIIINLEELRIQNKDSSKKITLVS